MRSIWLAIV